MHPMSGAGEHGGGRRYGDHHQPAADDDVGSMFFQSSACGDGAVDGGLTPRYSSITDYLQGVLDPAGLARHLDGPTGEAVHRGSAAGDVTIGRAGPAAAPATNTSTSGEVGRGNKGWPAPVKDEEDEEGSADRQDCRSDGKKQKKEKKERGSRVAFATKSEVDHLDDGYRWRKYGQKAVKNSSFPRSYYRCTTARCGVKKQVERSQQDPSTVVTTYEGHHAHPSPGAQRGMATGLYSLATLQQQRHGFCPSSPDDLLLAAAAGAMAPAAAAASPVAPLPPHQAENRFVEYYGVQLRDVLLDPLARNQHGHR